MFEISVYLQPYYKSSVEGLV